MEEGEILIFKVIKLSVIIIFIIITRFILFLTFVCKLNLRKKKKPRQLCFFARAAVTVTQTGWLNNLNLFAHNSGG